MSPIGSTPRMSFAEELEMTAALCHSCESVWLNAELPSAVNGDLSECWLGVNTTCWDCRRDYPSSTCSHAYFHSHPAPVSGRFSFCSGHSATNVDEMSSFAWMRVIAWRSQVCLPLYGRHLGNTNSAWEASDYADRTQPDAFWLRFYKEGTSRRREQWTV